MPRPAPRAIIACGTTGEPSTMSIAERELAIRTCVEAAERAACR